MLVARMGEERGVYRFLVGKPEGRRPLGRPRRRWADNIRPDLQEAESRHLFFGHPLDLVIPKFIYNTLL